MQESLGFSSIFAIVPTLLFCNRIVIAIETKSGYKRDGDIQ